MPCLDLAIAELTARSKSPGSRGLQRNATAPSDSAPCLVFSSGWPVIIIVGNSGCSLFILSCSSRPCIPGIRMSVMRQLASARALDLRASSAEANDITLKSADHNKDSRAFRISESSSTITTVGCLERLRRYSSALGHTVGTARELSIMSWYGAVKATIFRA